MKKNHIFLTVVAVIAILVSACNNSKPKSVELKDGNDSLNYAFGYSNGKIIKEYHLSKDSTGDGLKDLLAGIEAGLDEKIIEDEKLQNITELGKMIGSQLKSNKNFYGDSTISVDYKLIRQGLINGITEFKGEFTAETAQNYFNSTMEALQKKKSEEMYKENKLSGELFLKENAKKAGVVTTASGLQYEVIKEGNGAKPVATDKVKVHYHGTFVNGEKFDSSVERNEPAEFVLNEVIKGWTEGVQLMSVGSKYKFYVPQELAYGNQERGNIKPYSTLIFEVELLGIVK
jgi:FKBP-type peptidyl-prolyl cis-trans isomerase FklB